MGAKKSRINCYGAVLVPTAEEWEEYTSIDPFELRSGVRVGEVEYDDVRAPVKPSKVRKTENTVVPVQIKPKVITYTEMWTKLKNLFEPHHILIKNTRYKEAVAYRDYLDVRLCVNIVLDDGDLKSWEYQLDKILGQVVTTIALQKIKREGEVKNGNTNKGEGSSPS